MEDTKANREQYEETLKKYNLDASTLKKYFYLKCKGAENTAIADSIKIHRITVSRLNAKLRDIDKSDFLILYEGVRTFGG